MSVTPEERPGLRMPEGIYRVETVRRIKDGLSMEIEVQTNEGGEKFYVGAIQIGVLTPMGMTLQDVPFRINATSPKEAFEKLPELAQEEARKLQKASQSKIVRPDQIDPGQLAAVKTKIAQLRGRDGAPRP